MNFAQQRGGFVIRLKKKTISLVP